MDMQSARSRDASALLLTLEKNSKRLKEENKLMETPLKRNISSHWYSIHYRPEWFQRQQKTMHCCNAKNKRGNMDVVLLLTAI